MKRYLKINENDNVIVALEDIQIGDEIIINGVSIIALEPIAVKHKMAIKNIEKNERIRMYGLTVGLANNTIFTGARISTENTSHATEGYNTEGEKYIWKKPNVTKFEGRTFNGFHRKDGSVGIRNYWIILPLVFCEKRNVEVIQEALLKNLGYPTPQDFTVDTHRLIDLYKSGSTTEDLLKSDILMSSTELSVNRVFKNVDGVKILNHDMGCGGTHQDAEALCRLLAGYVLNPNVAGATVLSLGCQHAQVSLFNKCLNEFNPNHGKPVYIFEQQKYSSERDLISDAVKHTFVGMAEANQLGRKPAPITKICVGLECGGSDGFSGITANPALGHASDILVALGGTTILSEFPELCGAEQDLINRCTKKESATKFAHLMKTYGERAEAVGSGFYANPSPGNIRDGLITDAMKSLGAAKKGGNAEVTGVLDYTERVSDPGFYLLCTPGNDVESDTAFAASGTSIIAFTTGLGTPTGNPVAPTVKISTNTMLKNRMPDIIDIDAGTIVSGNDTIESKGEELLEYIIQVANGDAIPHAERLLQDDFIPWKRGVSL